MISERYCVRSGYISPRYNDAGRPIDSSRRVVKREQETETGYDYSTHVDSVHLRETSMSCKFADISCANTATIHISCH